MVVWSSASGILRSALLILFSSNALGLQLSPAAMEFSIDRHGAGTARESGIHVGVSPNPLRLRGGFCGIQSCFGCFGSGTSMLGGDNDKDQSKTKRRVGRMERTAEIKAPLRKVYRVITDFEHYTDWSGNGIKKSVIKNQRPGMLEIDYTTGAFGVTFQFSLYWGLSLPNKVSFRTVYSTRMLRFIKGEYTLSKLKNGNTQVHFVIMADIPAPIPFFLKMAIAKILVRIAVNDLKEYLESEQCTINLAKYDKQENLLHTVRNRVTKLVTQVPGLVPAEGQPMARWLKVALLRMISFGGRIAAGWLVVSNIIWGASVIQRPRGT